MTHERKPNPRWFIAALLPLAGCMATDAPLGADEDIGAVPQGLYATGWEDLGGDVTDLSISSQSSSRFDVWGIGTGSVWHKVVVNGFGSGWENGAGKPAGRTLTGVAAVYRGGPTKCTDVVATDTLQKVWVNTWCDVSWSWSGWNTVGSVAGAAVGKPAVSAVPSANRLDVWIRGTDDGLWHAYKIEPNPWSGWINEGRPTGGFAAPPAVITRTESPLVIEVVARGTSDRFWHRTWSNNAWGSWQDKGPVALTGGPTLASSGSGQLTVLARAASGSQILKKTWTTSGGWTAFAAIAPSINVTAGPEARYVSSKLEILVAGSAANVWRKSQEVDIPEAQTIIGFWGKCLRVDNVLTAAGNPRVVLETCDGGMRHRWMRQGDSIRSVYNNQCLTVENGATGNGSAVVTHTCSQNLLPSERWNIQASGPVLAPVLQIKGVGSSRCLRVPAAPNPPNGTAVTINSCVGQPNDRWYMGDGTANRIRIKAFALQDDDAGTNRTTITKAKLQAYIAEANEVYLRAGIRLELGDSDWILLTDPILNRIQDKSGSIADLDARALASSYPGYVTLLLRNLPGGGFSGYSTTSDYIAMPSDSGNWPMTFAHEVGHYFSLAHTMWDALYMDCGTGNDCYNIKAWTMRFNDGLDADGLEDTPDDPGPWVYERREGLKASPPVLPGIPWASCVGPEAIVLTDPTSPATATETPDRRNLMSYFMHCWSSGASLSISPQQLALVRTALFGSNRMHLLEVIK